MASLISLVVDWLSAGVPLFSVWLLILQQVSGLSDKVFFVTSVPSGQAPGYKHFFKRSLAFFA